LEKERKLFLGLRGIDSVAAYEYLNLPSATERKYFYEQYWSGRNEEREEFEKRCEYAFKEFGKYAPLSDERIPIYVKYGNPTKRYIISPEKKVGILSKEFVRPAEIWTYKDEGIEFDFIRIARAFQIIARSKFGEKVIIPFLKEDTSWIMISDSISQGSLNFELSFGRFRQRKNLVRLEIYTSIPSGKTTNGFYRNIFVYNQAESLIVEKKDFLKPQGNGDTLFYDEVNLWLEPQRYYLIIEYFNLNERLKGRKEIAVDLLDYKEDAKKISDLVFASLIDDSFTDQKFDKPSGRIIPLVRTVVDVHTPFYFYHEVYNLAIKEGMHMIKTDYEIYNKEKMQKEVVDILTQGETGEGDIAYISAKYHPMDLPPGEYIVVARTTDLLIGEEYTAVGEFVLKKAR